MRKRGLAGALLAIGLLAPVAGCEEDVSYSYVEVSVSFDPAIDDDRLALVAGCEVAVSGADEASSGLGGCRSNMTPGTLGTFDFSTERSSGVLYFTVIATDRNRELIAMGATGAVTIVPGGVARSSVVLAPVAPPAP